MIYIRFRIILAPSDKTFIRVSVCLCFGPDLTQLTMLVTLHHIGVLTIYWFNQKANMIYIRFRIILAATDTPFIRVGFCPRFGPDLTQLAT